jgi:hypothetical protein
MRVRNSYMVDRRRTVDGMQDARCAIELDGLAQGFEGSS